MNEKETGFLEKTQEGVGFSDILFVTILIY